LLFLVKKKQIINLFRALKNQMMVVQTLSDNNQIKLDKNEQQIEQVNFFLVCVFVLQDFVF